MIIIVLKFLRKINIDISEETLHDIKASRSDRALPSSRRSYCDRETGSVPARRKFGGLNVILFLQSRLGGSVTTDVTKLYSHGSKDASDEFCKKRGN